MTTPTERLEFMRGVVIAKMKLHPNDTTYVRFNSEQLMALIDVAVIANNQITKSTSLELALKRLADT